LASGIPDHQVAGLGGLRHLPVIYRATRSDPVVQLAEVLLLPINLKHVNLNHGTFPAQTSARRDVISPKDVGGHRSPTPSGNEDGSGCASTEQPDWSKASRQPLGARPYLRQKVRGSA
jgi:hypothetical protein